MKASIRRDVVWTRIIWKNEGGQTYASPWLPRTRKGFSEFQMHRIEMGAGRPLYRINCRLKPRTETLHD